MKFVSTLILMCLSTLVFASDVGYEVEVIIFEDRSGLYENSELWPMPDISEEANTTTTLLSEAMDANGSDIKKPANSTVEDLFQLIQKENYRLTEYVEKLSNIPDYNVLVHKAWNQPGLDQEHAVPFKIDSRKEAQISNDDTEQSATDNKTYIDGTVTLIMSRYLHFNTQLVLHKTINDETREYTVVSDRRMRSRELHYIDNPHLGVIVLATPFKIQTESDAAAPEGYKTL